jgi:hypothetical protein
LRNARGQDDRGHAGEKISDLQFSVGKVRLHTVLSHIVSADGSLLPLAKFGVSIDAPERDALAYYLTQTRNINGEFPAGYVPTAAGPENREDSSGTIALADGETRDVYRNGLGNYP